MRRIAAVVAIIATISTIALPSSADPVRDDDSLTSSHEIVQWSGSTEGGPPLAPIVHTADTCDAAGTGEMCDSFELELDLPEGTFTEPRDGVFVAIRWGSDFVQWNMYVYGPDGTLVASANDVASNAQAVLLAQPLNGRYTIVAAAASLEPMTYSGEARVLLDRTARMRPDTVLAPRLWTVPPFDLHMACSEPDPQSTPTNGRCTDVPAVPSNPTGWRWGGGWMNSCFADETEYSVGALRRCLRFSNNIRNTGDGPLILRAALVEGATSRECRMHQVVLTADGTEHARDAGACEFHAAHAHVHYLNTSQYLLIPAPDDTVTQPDLSAPPVATTRKLGYCLIDIDLWGDARKPSELSSRRWSFPTCDTPSASASEAEGRVVQEMGISPGWGDIYTWDLPGQYLDVTDVPDGVYDIVSIANPDCSLMESAPGMEGAATRIHLEGTSVKVLAEFGPFGVPDCKVPSVKGRTW